MKVDRMLGILTILTERKRVKAKDLAERFEVSLRTVYRDVESISMAGIPIVTFPGADGGIGIADGFKLDKSALTPDELQSIVLGLKSIASVIAGSQISALVRKLSHEPDRFITLKDDVVIDLASHYQDSLAPKISLLRQAIADRVAVSFGYYSKTGRTERELEPYFVAFRWSAWYVFGYCRLRKDFRLFKLNRVVEMRLTESHYELRSVPEKQADLDAFYSDPETKQYATLLLSRNLEYVLVDEYGPESYEPVDGNTLRAKWDYVDEAEMVKTILRLGGGAKVVEPRSLAEAVRAEAERILGQYERS